MNLTVTMVAVAVLVTVILTIMASFSQRTPVSEVPCHNVFIGSSYKGICFKYIYFLSRNGNTANFNKIAMQKYTVRETGNLKNHCQQCQLPLLTSVGKLLLAIVVFTEIYKPCIT